jgi:protein disulfide-isomerase A1
VRHLSRGGELITHLWALLYHLNICAWKQFNEKHVVALTDSGFSDMIRTRRRVMVSFYNPSWSQSEELAPEYAAAAAYLADQKVDVVLAKVDTTKDTDLAQRYEVRKEFLTILFFVDGIPSPYAGAKTKTAIVDWINKNLNPGVHDIANVDDAKRIRNEINGSAVVAFLDHPSV